MEHTSVRVTVAVNRVVTVVGCSLLVRGIGNACASLVMHCGAGARLAACIMLIAILLVVDVEDASLVVAGGCVTMAPTRSQITICNAILHIEATGELASGRRHRVAALGLVNRLRGGSGDDDDSNERNIDSMDSVHAFDAASVLVDWDDM